MVIGNAVRRMFVIQLLALTLHLVLLLHLKLLRLLHPLPVRLVNGEYTICVVILLGHESCFPFILYLINSSLLYQYTYII